MPAGLGQAFQDGTLVNGVWQAVFTPSVIGISLPEFECYHIVVDGGPVGSKFTVMIGNRKYDRVDPGWDTSWDPNQPMKLENGDTVTYTWNSGAAPAPEVWMYFQERTPL